MKISGVDLFIIVAYFISLLLIGIVASFRVKDTDGFFLAKRGFGKLLMVAQSFGVGTHADAPVSLAGAVYSTGISAIWFQWKNLFATPFFWIMAPVFRRARRTTTAELVEDRFGQSVSGLYVLFGLVYFTINIASIMKGAAKVLDEVLGGQVGPNQIVLCLAIIFTLYSVVGGLVASVWSDCLQGVLIISLSFLLIPLGWGMVGGFIGMKQALPRNHFSLATPEGIGPWFILMLTLNGLIGIIAQPHVMAAVGSGKDEHSCRIGFFYGNFMKRLCTVGWAITGLMVAVLVKKGSFGTHSLADPEDAFGFACLHLLHPGFRGLLVAGIMGASLASSSALMVDSGALFTQGLYRQKLVRGRTDRHYLWVGRLSGFGAVVVAVVYALFLIDKVLYSFLLTETMATYVGISILGGIIWRRANRWGAVSSFVVALSTSLLIYHLRHQRLDAWDPNIFLASLLAGSASFIVVSLLTRAEPETDTISFFSRLQTPSDFAPHAPPRPEPGGSDSKRKPICDSNQWVADRGDQLLIVNLLHLRRAAHDAGFLKAYRRDLKGLFVGSALSAALVFGLWLIVRS
jgi:Na+/proline symporter